MDSFTQIILGASVGAAVMGKRYGRKAALVGAICGTIPDLDVMIPMDDPVSSMTYHRGFSHSILFTILFAPILVWILSKIKWFNFDFKDRRTHVGVFLTLVTHPILDCFTIYGTQIFWPLPVAPTGWGSIFIIDPLYTLPFLLFLIYFLITKSLNAVYTGLIISTLYLAWTVGAQNYIYNIVNGQTDSEKILVQPAPFNTVLWRVLLVNDDNYEVGYYSFFDKTTDITFKTYESDLSLLPENWAAKRLKWFTKGFYGVLAEGDNIVMSDLRMGLEPDDYVFQFIVNTEPNQRYERPRNISRLDKIWDRAFRDAPWNGTVQSE